MSSWCNNVHTQQQDNKISNWIDLVPANTSMGGFLTPIASVVCTPNLSMGDDYLGSESAAVAERDNDGCQSVLCDSSSFVRGLRGAVDSSRASSAQNRSLSSSINGVVIDDVAQGEADCSQQGVTEPSDVKSALVAEEEAPSSLIPPPRPHAHRLPSPITSPHMSGSLPSMCFLGTATQLSYSRQHQHPTTQTTSTTRPRDAMKAIEAQRIPYLSVNDCVGADCRDVGVFSEDDDDGTNVNSMNSVSISIPNVLSQGGATPLGGNAFVQINVENHGHSVHDSSSRPTSPVAPPEKPCTFVIQTQAISQPNRKSTTSAVSLNECVYNLEHWDEGEHGWFVVPTDNVADLEDDSAFAQFSESQRSPMAVNTNVASIPNVEPINNIQPYLPIINQGGNNDGGNNEFSPASIEVSFPD